MSSLAIGGSPAGILGLGKRALVRVPTRGGGLALMAPLWLWWAISADGGYAAGRWLPGVMLIGVAAVILYRTRAMQEPQGARLAALAALGLLALLSALSLAWAADRGGAAQAFEWQALLLGSFALPLLWPPDAAWLRGCCLILVGCAGLGLLWALTGDAGLASGRLSAPTGYPNAAAAILIAAALPAMALSAAEASAALSRAALGAAGAVFLAAALMTQSRGAMIGAAAGIGLLICLSPHRLRALATVTLQLAVVAAWADTLLGVRVLALGGEDPASRARLLLLGVAVTALIGSWVLVKVTPAPAGECSADRPRSRSVAVALATAGLVGLLASVPLSQGFGGATDAHYSRVESSDVRLTAGLDSNRPDYWRVGGQTLLAAPLTGDGAGSFPATYLQHRTTGKAPLHAHSIWVEAGAELGLPGLLALLAFAGATALAVVQRWRSATVELRVAIGAAALPAAYLLVHSSADWVSFYPALTAPALGLVAAAIAVQRRPGQKAPAAVATVAVLAMAAVIAVPLLTAEVLTSEAAATWQQNSGGSLSSLRLAGALDPLSAGPALNSGLIALETGSPGAAEAAFAAVVARNPSNWFGQFELGLIRAGQGRDAEARAALTQAQRLNPREPLIGRAAVQSMTPLWAARTILGDPD
ncbi:MAG: hypothetical protein QOG62_1318 [Thermoleophilaceae bacterium]|jgi:hypothetical protein|nr:hypothetical protein [Thermoleophilaceae bacterium]